MLLVGSKIKNKKSKPELQIIISNRRPELSSILYKERWQCETAFRALKSSGLNIEDTHSTDIDQIGKLLSLVLIAFTWSYLVGIYLNENMKPIRNLNNGRRAKGFFKYGLEYIVMMLLNTGFQSDINIFIFCHVLSAKIYKKLFNKVVLKVMFFGDVKFDKKRKLADNMRAK